MSSFGWRGTMGYDQMTNWHHKVFGYDVETRFSPMRRGSKIRTCPALDKHLIFDVYNTWVNAYKRMQH